MKTTFLGTALATLAAFGAAQASTFTADFSGGGSIAGGAPIVFDNTGGVIDEARLQSNRLGIEGGVHVRAFGEFLEDDTYSFVNSAMGHGNSMAFAETVISLEFTNTGALRQQITLNSTIIPGALGVFFAENCSFSDDGGPDLFDCQQAVDHGRELGDEGNAATTALAISVRSNGVETDGFSLGLSTTAGAPNIAPTITTDFDDAAKLTNFRQLNAINPVTDSIFYRWDESVVRFFGGLVDPGETVSLEIVFHSMVIVDDALANCDVCLASFMGFGDPIGAGSDDNGTFKFEKFQSSFTAEITIEGTFEDPIDAVPVPGAVWLMGAGVAGLAARRRLKRG